MIDPAVVRGAQIELARRDFWSYCNLKAPQFYKQDRIYLKDFCQELQSFHEGKAERILIVNMPPRHGKSRTLGCFEEWILGKNTQEKIITGSYNETLSTTFAKNVRNTIAERKADRDRVVYSDIFPKTRIKYGDGSMNLWSLEGGYNNFLATSPTGTATGFGADIMVIDDVIKNAEEANNAAVLEKHWEWFVNTMLSRLEEGGKIVICMTRWHSMDLAGRALVFFREAGQSVRHVSYKALQDDGTMLCPEILSEQSYREKIRAMGADIASANYQQIPIDIKGRLYSSFKTYEKLPCDSAGQWLFTAVRNYTDTADEGDDYLCSINYGVYNQEVYILNLLYTKAPMEETEPATAKMLLEDHVQLAVIESNNGGRGFARAVQQQLRNLGSNFCDVQTFHQRKNKQARILTNATWIMNHVYFPVNWRDRWPEYYDSMICFQREGKNAHDDAQDATTGIVEVEQTFERRLS